MSGQSTFSIKKWMPILTWARAYDPNDLKGDLAAGLTVGAMLVPQAMAYALLAGLPPEVGLYAATIPLVVYAVFGTSRQLAVGPVAIASLMTASALASVVEEGTAGYLEAAALLALMVGTVHIVLGVGRLGFFANFLSHSVLVGFTAAAAIIIGFSQVKHLLGISLPRSEEFYQTVIDVVRGLGDTHGLTLGIGLGSLATLIALKRFARTLPAALVVVVASTALVALLDLEQRGVKVVGDIPGSLPTLSIPGFDGSVISSLAVSAIAITLVSFVESTAVATVYARRNRYQIEPNNELVALGAANLASGMFGGYPVTGGFSRTAVSGAAGAKTPFAAIVTAAVVLMTIAVLTPLFHSLPNAALGAIIVVAITGLIDIGHMRHIAKVKRSDTIGMTIAFVGTLLLGVELGLLVAVVASFAVVFARMSVPHTAVLGQVDGTASYRNVERFGEVHTTGGIRIIRIDAAVTFVNAVNVKKLIMAEAACVTEAPRVLIVDASGINDLDATGADMLSELMGEMDDCGVSLRFSDLKGPVRDVLHRAQLWEVLGTRVHASTADAVAVAQGLVPAAVDQRRAGIDERQGAGVVTSPTSGQPTIII